MANVAPAKTYAIRVIRLCSVRGESRRMAEALYYSYRA
jgi:hypothetical protein